MAIVLKSNVVATKSLGHISGIVGPRDYSGVIDFVNRKMIEDNIEKDIFSANSLTLNNPDNNYLSIYDPISNTLTKKLSQTSLATHLDYLGEKGLVGYGYVSNWMADADGYLTATKTRTIGVGAAGKLVTLQVFGTGTVTISGDVSDQGEGLTATYEKPITILLTGSNPIVTATVSGNVLHYQLLPKNKIYKNIAVAFRGLNLGVYSKPRSTPLSNCSFLFHANLSGFGTFNERAYQLLFALQVGQSDYLAVLVENNQIRFAFVSPRDSEVPYVRKPIQIGAVVVAVTLANNRLKVFFNGEKVFDFTATANIPFSNADFIRSGAVPNSASGLNGTIKKLFTYSRAVNDAEAIQMTNSFNF